METVQQLVLLYAGLVVINFILSGVLWYSSRAPLNRDLFRFWASVVVFFLSQAFFGQGTLAVALSCLPAFLISFTLASLLSRIAGITMRAVFYLAAVVLGTAAAIGINAAGGPFWAVALPPSVAVALPLIVVPLRCLLRADNRLTVLGKASMLSALLSGLHDLDYPFLRDKPQFAVLGFSIGLLAVFAISITAPATVLEVVTAERTRIERQNQFERRFFANVTHELRTPLTMILAPIESMLAGTFGPLTPRQRASLEANWRNSIRLLRLINDLLDLAKLEEGHMSLRAQESDLRSLLSDLVEDARPLAAHKGIDLALIFESAPTDLHVDVEKIERVFVNLVANALKFTETGSVTVRVSAGAGGAEIAVEDTGVGIPADRLPHLFQRFSQGDDSVTRRFGGTGIGLAYAKEIVELHGGRITMSSEVGKGSRFVVHLPGGVSHLPVGSVMADGTSAPREWTHEVQRQKEYRFAEVGEAALRSAEVAAGTSSSGARLLLVEDNPEILEFVAMHLRENFTVLTARDGQEGLTTAQRELPDVIVTDFMMPKMDGLSMVKTLRVHPKLADVPVIMLTAKGELADRLSGREAGADVYLTKPFSPRELEAAIRQQLGKRGHQVHSLMRAHVEGLEIVSAGLAHEIQNPLNFIKNAQKLIEENVAKLRDAVDMPTDPVRAASVDKAQSRIAHMVETAGKGVKRIENVVGLMRRYAREGYPTEPADVDLERAVADVVELVAPRGEVPTQIALALASGGRSVRAVPEDLNQVIRSLVQNAIEAVAPLGAEGRVTVGSRLDGEHVVLEVIDNGPGVVAADLGRIFSPFFTTKPGPGRGLGLAIVQIVVARSGGTVDVTSTPGRETAFRVQFPAGQPVIAITPLAPVGPARAVAGANASA